MFAVETWLTKETTSNFISTDYTFIRSDRPKGKKKKGGGVFIAYKNHYKITEVRKIKTSSLIETVFAKHQINNETILYGCVYVSPAVNIEKLNCIDDMLN